MACAVVAWSCAPASSTATTTAAQPKASSKTTTPAAPSLRRRVQKGMWGIYGGDGAPSATLGQNLLEQCERAWVVRLAEPKQRFLAHARTGMCARDADQGRHAVVPRQLGQGEHRALLHFEPDAPVVHQLGEPAGRAFARRWTEPEDRGAPRLLRHGGCAGETQQV